MSNKNDYNGTDDSGAVKNESYCMPSMQKENVSSMNDALGYHDMGDLANTKPYPVQMSDGEGVRRNSQLEPRMPASNKNDRSER
jgi:hypothetical protein